MSWVLLFEGEINFPQTDLLSISKESRNNGWILFMFLIYSSQFNIIQWAKFPSKDLLHSVILTLVKMLWRQRNLSINPHF